MAINWIQFSSIYKTPLHKKSFQDALYCKVKILQYQMEKPNDPIIPYLALGENGEEEGM